MGSILTNTSAQVALQTLRGVNRDLNTVQEQISTGLAVGSSRDDAAVFAIAQTSRSDVAGFEAIQTSLDLGASTLAVASTATTEISNLLNDIRGQIVNAGNSGLDANTIQNEIDSLVGQVTSIVSAAQLNGVNLIDGSAGTFDILSSLDRDATGAVSTSTISLASIDLSTAAGAAITGALTGTTGATANTDDTFAAFTLEAGAAAGSGAPSSGDIVIDAGLFAAGDQISVTISGQTATYTVTADDVTAVAATDESVVLTGVRDAILDLGLEGVVIEFDGGSPNTINIGNDGANAIDRAVTVEVQAAGTGGLADLSSIDVTSPAGQAAALTTIENLSQTVIAADAAIGTVESRVAIQAEFQQVLIDNFNAGIGSLVDADLEAASAELNALQVQQQLATQALTIANQQPQSILALFR